MKTENVPATDGSHMEDRSHASPELSMQVKKRIYGKFHILSLEDRSKANAWRLKTYLAIDISLNNA